MNLNKEKDPSIEFAKPIEESVTTVSDQQGSQFEFKEMGVKIDKDQAPAGFYYFKDAYSENYRKSLPSGSNELINVSSTAYESVVKESCHANTKVWFGQVVQRKGKLEPHEGSREQLLKQFDDQYISLIPSVDTQACRPPEGGQYREVPALSKAAEESISALKKAFASAEQT